MILFYSNIDHYIILQAAYHLFQILPEPAGRLVPALRSSLACAGDGALGVPEGGGLAKAWKKRGIVNCGFP